MAYFLKEINDAETAQLAQERLEALAPLLEGLEVSVEAAGAVRVAGGGGALVAGVIQDSRPALVKIHAEEIVLAPGLKAEA